MYDLETLRTKLAKGIVSCGEDGLAFQMKTKKGVKLRVIVSIGLGWDHVSVSRVARIPTWDDMEAVKRMVFKPDETAMQLHVPPTDHINIHPTCLHMWRPHDQAIPLPPTLMV